LTKSNPDPGQRESILYQIPQGIRLDKIRGRVLLSNPSQGKIVLDPVMLSIWRAADGRTTEDILVNFPSTSGQPERVLAALACLVEAGLLQRDIKKEDSGQYFTIEGPLVSVVIVSFNSRNWLEICLPSLLSQTYSHLEVVVVDNASKDNTIGWLEANYPNIKSINLEESESLASAINIGIGACQGEYFAILNPDVALKPDAIAQMVAVAKADPTCAVVTSKLKLMWAPAFLNGLGNYVGPVSWGTDVALGHLDLGQFDDWQESPSACFAGALIPAKAWEVVGPLDESLPMYYEDSEWSYRARLFGYRVRVAPQAVIYHAFSGRVPSEEERGIDPRKLQMVIYGRLNFATKILSVKYLLQFIVGYLIEDILSFFAKLFRRNWRSSMAYLSAWSAFLRALPNITRERKVIQSRRLISDEEIFKIQKKVPVPLVWRGLPLLTWDLVRSHYFHLMISGKAANIPEFSKVLKDPNQDRLDANPDSPLVRALGILRLEGFGSLLHRGWKYLQWYLMRP
jgi:GT2 family glycosyltransferase